jgi:hypothetical protein
MLKDSNESWDPEEADGPADLDDYGAWKLLRDRSFADRPSQRSW